MAVRIEDAGFEIRDMIAWVYGSGFPKSLDVSKAIDKAAGAEREVVGKMENPASSIYSQSENEMSRDVPITAPATPEAKQWQGWGTALKPALEPITVARKPLIGTVAENVLQHGTGAINVDGGRVGERWPANFIHDGSEEVVGLFPVTNTKPGSAVRNNKNNPYGSERTLGVSKTPAQQTAGYTDTGSAARFFYCAKASKADRDENHHPTVKPTDLMRYLCRLVTPQTGIVLDPFMGSGSTGKAAMLEGFAFVGIEREAEYIDIAKARIQSAVGLL